MVNNDPTDLPAHIPGRPGWLCLGCREPWPCRDKRVELLYEYAGDLIGLRVAMGWRLVDAMADLPLAMAGDLLERFVGWVPRGKHQAAEPGT